MFRDFSSERVNEQTSSYHLIDYDFEDIGDMNRISSFMRVRVCQAVIEVYEKRGLNVASNLALAIQWFRNDHLEISLENVLLYNREANPKFPQYEDELMKYLMLV